MRESQRSGRYYVIIRIVKVEGKVDDKIMHKEQTKFLVYFDR